LDAKPRVCEAKIPPTKFGEQFAADGETSVALDVNELEGKLDDKEPGNILLLGIPVHIALPKNDGGADTDDADLAIEETPTREARFMVVIGDFVVVAIVLVDLARCGDSR